MRIKNAIILTIGTMLLSGCSQPQKNNTGHTNDNTSQIEISLDEVFNESAEKLLKKDKVNITSCSTWVDWNHMNHYEDGVGGPRSITGVYGYDIVSIICDNKTKQNEYNFFTNNGGLLDIDHDSEWFDTHDNKYHYGNEQTLPISFETIINRMNWMKDSLLKQEGYASQYIIQNGQGKKYIDGIFDKDLKIVDYGYKGDMDENCIAAGYNNSILELFSKSNVLGEYTPDDTNTATYNAFFFTRFIGQYLSKDVKMYTQNQHKDGDNTVLTINLNTKSSDYTGYMNSKKYEFDLNDGKDDGEYIDDEKIKITIDKDGCLKKYEVESMYGFLNEDYKNIKVPNMLDVEFSY